MAPRNEREAMSTVAENFGLTADDLGMDRENPFEGLDFGEGDDVDGENDQLSLDADLGEGNDLQAPDASQQTYQDLRVSHTPPQQRQPTQQQQPRPLPAASGLTTDKKGNILNAEGRIVANAGREARLFQDNHKLKGQVNTVMQQANAVVRSTQGKLEQAVEIGMALSRQLQEMRAKPQLESEFGISNSELRFAAELARSAKTDPIGTLKTLLTKAATSGIDLTQLGLQPGGFDTAALMRMVREEIAKGVEPVTQMTAQQRQAQEAQTQRQSEQQAINSELTDFLNENPAAKGYLAVFKEIYSQPALAKLSLGEVWTRIKLNLLRRGIDVDNPQQQYQQQQQRTQNRQQPRVPNGRGNPPGGGNQRQQPMEMAPVSASYEDIVRSVMTGTV